MPLLTSTRDTRQLGIDFRKFPVKTNKKNWSYQSKTFKTGFLPKNDHFFTLFGQKIPNFEFSHGYLPLLAHASRYLGEDFRKFSAKTNDKKLKLLVKTFKKLDFWQKITIFWHFLAKKIPNFEFYRKYNYSHTLVDT